MNFIKQTFQGHTIVKVDYHDDAIRQKAYDQAAAKAKYTNRNNPAAKRRTDQEVFNAQYLGTLADLACSHLLQESLNLKGSGSLSVERYDDVRMDNFMHPDLFDARVTRNGQSLAEIEIRSSVCNRVSLERMLDIWHVLGWYVTANKPAEKIKEFYFRPIYHYNRYRTRVEYKLADAAKYLADGSLNLYIVGGATADLLEQHGEVQPGWGLLQEGATYQVIAIRKALDAPEFLDNVYQYCISK